MGSQKTQYQGGSIVSFIIVTVVIGALLIGGVMWLRQRGEVANNTQPTETTQEESTTESGAETETRNDSESAPSQLPGSTDEATESDDRTEASPGSTGTRSDTSDEANTASPSALPETGPAETLAAIVALSTLSFAAARYVQSRRTLIQASLQ